MSWALQIRWWWLAKTDKERPWSGLEVPVHQNAKALFAIAVHSHVGNGNDTYFWTDRWLFGCCIEHLAPNVYTLVPQRFRNRTVAAALHDQQWPSDLQGGLSMIGLFEYFQLWDIIQDFMLSPNEDSHSWRFETSGVFTTKSAYRAFFHGSINFEPWRRIWKTWAPPKCKVFLWLAVRDRCWTADRLAKRN